MVQANPTQQLAQQAELQNYNFGFHVKNQTCKIHPTIVSNILDHNTRRPAKQDVILGTLLGTVDGTRVDIQSSFAVPLSLDEDKSIIIDSEYSEKMLKFQRKVNPKEGLIGFYQTGKAIDENTLLFFHHYSKLIKNKRNRVLLPKPLLLLIDPSMDENRLTIKILSFYSAPEVRLNEYTTPEDGEEVRSIEQVQIFAEVPYKIGLDNYEKTGLDVIFFGQDSFDTMAILQDKANMGTEQITSGKDGQMLLSNKDLLGKNFAEVIVNLKECESYVQDIIDGKEEGDSELGRALDDCLGQFSTDDMNLLESLIASNFEDALMINSLSKLQQHQLAIAGQLNQLFAESIKTNNQFLSSIKKRDQK